MAGITFPMAKEVEWADQKLYFEGTPLTAIKGLKFGVKTDKAHLHAEGDSPIGIQSGNREPTGSFKVLKSVLDVLNTAAVSAGGRDVNDLEFSLVVTYKKQGIRALQTITLTGCQTNNFQYGWDQGAKEMDIELPFLYLDLLFG